MACFIFTMDDDSIEYITADRYLEALIKLYKRVSKKGTTISSFRVSSDKCSVVKKAEATNRKYKGTIVKERNKKRNKKENKKKERGTNMKRNVPVLLNDIVLEAILEKDIEKRAKDAFGKELDYYKVKLEGVVYTVMYQYGHETDTDKIHIRYSNNTNVLVSLFEDLNMMLITIGRSHIFEIDMPREKMNQLFTIARKTQNKYNKRMGD